MIRLIDIGNSRVKFADWVNGSLENASVCSHEQVLDAVNSASALSSVVACSVAAPRLADAINGWCEQQKIPVEWVTSKCEFAGLTHSYANPEALGNDRWVAMVGACSLYCGNLFVVDCGTATTVDIVNADGRHLGGAIFPGIATMRDALNRNTHGLLPSDADVQVFANNTEDAIAGGTVYALCGAIERLYAEAQQHTDADLKIILTGGESEIISPFLRHRFTLDTTLVLSGLSVVADEHKRKR